MAQVDTASSAYFYLKQVIFFPSCFHRRVGFLEEWGVRVREVKLSKVSERCPCCPQLQRVAVGHTDEAEGAGLAGGSCSRGCTECAALAAHSVSSAPWEGVKKKPELRFSHDPDSL